MYGGGLGAKLALNMCIAAVGHDQTPSDIKVSIRTCNYSDPFQQWELGNYTDIYANIMDRNGPSSHVKSNKSIAFYDEYSQFLRNYPVSSNSL